MANYSVSNTVTLTSGSTVTEVVTAAVNASTPGAIIDITSSAPLVPVIVGLIESVAQSATPVGKFSFSVNGNPGGAGTGGVSVTVQWLPAG